MRTLTRTLALALGLFVFAGSTALAASQEKTEYKETKKDHKTIAKFVKKYDKAIAKGKTDKYDADIKEWAKNELADLRGMGVKTKDDKPEPTHPMEGPAPANDDKEGMLDRLADVLKEVRDRKNPEKRLESMKEAERMYGNWEERRAKRL